MNDLLRKFENKRPEVIFEWKDSETEAEGWIVINSLRGNACGGGTRMRKGLNRYEVESLAKTMEIKFSVSGPPIGGAKSGINFDPADPRKKGVLERWFKAVLPLLKSYYGTGGDLNVDEIHDVIPITEKLGLMHPQEGTVNGFFKNGTDKKQIIEQLNTGVKKIIEDPFYSPDVSRKYKVADMITGFGVAESVKHFYKIYGGELKDKRVMVQGWGNVGAAAGFYLSQAGAKIISILDRTGGLINHNGFSFDEIRNLFLTRNGKHLQSSSLISNDELQNQIWNIGAEIFIPAASSRLVTAHQLEQLISSGLEVISCGANVPFADEKIFLGPVSKYADEHCSVIPDFIANCGMARTFAYLMQPDVSMNDADIFHDVSGCICDILKKVHNRSSSAKNISNNALNIILEQLLPN